jgi:hypothetical protein
MLTSLPGPAPGTVRRTLSLEVTPDPEWSAGLRITALGRDTRTSTTDNGELLRSVTMSVTIDAASRITGFQSDLPAAVTGRLTGAGAISGFRAKLADLDELDQSSLESAVLDELPTVRLISGYAQMIELTGVTGTAELQPHRDRRSPPVGICAGWAPGATADTRARAGIPVVTGTPAAQALASMTPYFHAEPDPRPRSMRRRRILDVTARGGGYEVYEYFRDSHFDADLREGALHEYEVHARAAADEGCRLERIDVVPHALPFGECPLAAPNAADLAGASLRVITGTVKERLNGTRSCTHLNDTLRFLRYVPALLPPGGDSPYPRWNEELRVTRKAGNSGS